MSEPGEVEVAVETAFKCLCEIKFALVMALTRRRLSPTIISDTIRKMETGLDLLRDVETKLKAKADAAQQENR